MAENKKKKSSSITHARYGCAIGAVNTVNAIKHAIPIANCGPGCADKQFITLSFSNGFQGADYAGGGAVPSVNTGENEIVFGGSKKLDSTLKSAFKIMDGDLFVVLTGCAPSLIGDDVGAIVRKYKNEGYPVVFADAAGFRGNNLIGHESVVNAIIEQYVGDVKTEKTKGLVNLWADVPYFDTNWKGNYSELKRILEGAGLKVNVLFGTDSEGVKSWKKIPKAQFNLVVSPWVGLSTAELLEEKYGQPYLHIPVVPVGEKETTAFIRKVVEFAGIDNKKAEKFIAKETSDYYYYYEHISEFISEYWFGLPARFLIAADAQTTLGISKFLTDQIGLIPAKVIISDNTPQKYREAIAEEFKNISDDTSIDVQFIEDGYTIEKEFDEADFGFGKPLFLATSWDLDVVRKHNGLFVPVGTPNNFEVVLNRTYYGYRGALTLLEKIYSEVVRG